MLSQSRKIHLRSPRIVITLFFIFYVDLYWTAGQSSVFLRILFFLLITNILFVLLKKAYQMKNGGKDNKNWTPL